jgi:hypothetical protein
MARAIDYQRRNPQKHREDNRRWYTRNKPAISARRRQKYVSLKLQHIRRIGELVRKSRGD